MTLKIKQSLLRSPIRHALAEALNLGDDLDQTCELERLDQTSSRTYYYPEVKENLILPKPVEFSPGAEGILMHAGGEVAMEVPYGSYVSKGDKGITLAIPQPGAPHLVYRIKSKRGG